jgi:hypothetical protein
LQQGNSIEATWVCVSIRNSENFLAALYKSPGITWSGSDVIEIINFRTESLLEGDLNAKSPIWNSQGSDPSGARLFELFDGNDFQISAPQTATHYTPREIVTCSILSP